MDTGKIFGNGKVLVSIESNKITEIARDTIIGEYGLVTFFEQCVTTIVKRNLFLSPILHCYTK